MEGQVRSFVAEKGFGFIDGADRQPYFFHASKLPRGIDSSTVREGMLVSFDPTPGRKGLEAHAIKVEAVHGIELIEPSEFVISKGSTPSRGRVFYALDCVLASQQARSPDEARRDVIYKAQQLGANALLNFHHDTGTGSAGNYCYTTHRFMGIPAIVAEEKASTRLNDVRVSEAMFAERVLAMEHARDIELARIAEEARTAPSGIGALAYVVLTVLFAYFVTDVVNFVGIGAGWTILLFIVGAMFVAVLLVVSH